MTLKKTLSRFIVATFVLVLACNIVFMGNSKALDQGNLIDDQLFDNSSSMSASQIDSFLNGFSYSCISTNSGFAAKQPTGYSPSGGFTYGGFVSAGQVIATSAQVYGINPQVLLATLQKEQSLVSSSSSYCNNGDEHKYAAAVGYGCPDGGTVYNWSGVSLYRRNGVEHTTTGSTCVNSAAKAGFSQQVIRAAWLLKFGQQRSKGNVNWAIVSGSWDNSDDPQSCYGGPMTQGTFQRCPGGPSTYYDGYYTIDSTSIHIESGATAALYWYTPHFHGNENFVEFFTNWFGSLSSCDYPKGSTPTPANIYGNAGTASVPGKWTAGAAQGYAYVTPNYTGGFDVAVMTPSSTGMVWQGIWWNQTNGNIGMSNTILIPAKNSEGLTDIYYATSTNWSKPGFTVGLMHNNGHGFTYAGTQWVTSSLSLAETTFIPGNFTPGGGAQGFAYATRNYSGGFDVAVMSPSGAGLVWQGVKWNQTNGDISRMNTVFIPADTDNDSLTDLYYATSVNWSRPGFTVGLMHNNGADMTWGGPQWTNGNLNLGTTSFLSGNWTGSGNGQGFAYVTACGSRGFDVSVMAPVGGTVQWRGQWWQAKTLPRTSTTFIPADQDGDGFTDLYYATPNGDYGFNVALQHNSAGGTYSWQGTQWAPTSFPLRSTLFLPSK